jgi:hypothetical protein
LLSVLNDSQLGELAREPAAELFQRANHASVVAPLIVLLAFLPGLLIFWNPSFNETTCLRGLRALDVNSGDSLVDWMVAASRATPEDSAQARPLASLLTATAMRIGLLVPEKRLLLAGYVSAVGLLFALAGLGRQLVGSRFAFLTVLLVATHHDFLTLCGNLPPACLPLTFALLSIRSLLAGQDSNSAAVSWHQVGSGLALAACWLSGAEVAMATFVALCLMTLLHPQPAVVHSTFRMKLKQFVLQLTLDTVKLLVVTMIAAAIIIAWQLAVMGKQPSVREFVANLLLWSIPKTRSTPASNWEPIRSLLDTLGAALGFFVLGLVSVLRDWRSRGDAQRRMTSRVLVIGMIVAGAGWWLNWESHRGQFTNVLAWPGLLLVAVLVMSARGCEGILRREFTTATSTVLIVIAVGFSLVRVINQFPSSLASDPAFVVEPLIVLTIAALVGWSCTRRWMTESRQQRLLLCGIVCALAVEVRDSVRTVQFTTNDERELMAFRRQLLEPSPPSHCWLLTDEPSPARLRFFVQSLWQDSEVRLARSWEELLVDPSVSRTTNTAQPPSIPVESLPRMVVITWGSHKIPSQELRRHGQILIQTTAPHYYRQRPLNGYRFTRRDSAAFAKAK